MRREIVKLKQTFGPDLIHINVVGRGDFFHVTTNNAHEAPFLVTLHGQWEKQIEPIMEHTLRDADWIAGLLGGYSQSRTAIGSENHLALLRHS